MNNQSAGNLVAVLIVFALLWLAMMTLILIAWTQVLRKAGYSGWWVLMGFIPVAGLVMFLVFAFSRWPVQDAAERAARLAYAPPQQSLPPNRRR